MVAVQVGRQCAVAARGGRLILGPLAMGGLSQSGRGSGWPADRARGRDPGLFRKFGASSRAEFSW
jgi:hypothetical protein